jgi:predicted dehydrogenase
VSELQIIQAGAGFWGSGWAKVITQSRWAELAALVDSDDAALRRVADSVGLPAERRFASLTEALERCEADAALVVVPPEAHAPVAMEALEAGLHCLIEKPLAPTFAEGTKIVEMGERVGREVMVSQTFRFRRGARTVQRLVEEGAIGKIGAVHGRLFKEMHVPGFRELMDEPLIVDQTIHHFDFIRGVFGLNPVRVRAHSYNPAWSWFRGNANAIVDFETDDGAFVSYSGSWVSRAGPDVNTTIDGTWDIQGDRGAIQWDHNSVTMVPQEFADVLFRPGTLERYGQTLEVALIPIEEEERAGVLREFADALRDRRPTETNGRQNLGSLALVLAAAEATKARGWVEISDFIRRSTVEVTTVSS